ncbi:hypothetical protein JTE90_007464 [Oedothorax gibbosus]|uniref:Radial spoke head protein 9 homolog n=1 Tax=Oedothorax gibbosus TaxID=931172 RepID=A0AAV6U8L1_9ARAC|nr:hypothetical protein JTE90_007464 [Oedothorax gibbosus]
MLKDKLNLKMDYFCSSGAILNVDEQRILEISLPMLQAENKFNSISFFAKIFGTKGDYYIALGRGEDYVRSKTFFYSLDGYSWKFMSPPSEDDLKSFHLVLSIFKGDPSCMHTIKDANETKLGYLVEERRLSALIKLIDFEATIGPKNALIINSKGIVKNNTHYTGLPKSETLNLQSYLHFRLPASEKSFAPSSELYPSGGNRATDFLEPISRDHPKGCWTLFSDSLQEVIQIRNLWWPGYRFYHIPETGEYRSMYIGFGQRNEDFVNIL